MTCEICHHGPPDLAVALYRVDGSDKWRCWYCLPQSQKDRLDPDMRGLRAIRNEQKDIHDSQTNPT